LARGNFPWRSDRGHVSKCPQSRRKRGKARDAVTGKLAVALGSLRANLSGITAPSVDAAAAKGDSATTGHFDLQGAEYSGLFALTREMGDDASFGVQPRSDLEQHRGAAGFDGALTRCSIRTSPPAMNDLGQPLLHGHGIGEAGLFDRPQPGHPRLINDHSHLRHAVGEASRSLRHLQDHIVHLPPFSGVGRFAPNNAGKPIETASPQPELAIECDRVLDIDEPLRGRGGVAAAEAQLPAITYGPDAVEFSLAQ
jgi:hypothetical protein